MYQADCELLQACRCGDENAAARALDAGANANARERGGARRSPLELAAAVPAPAGAHLLRRLVDAGARVRAANPASGATALHAAAAARGADAVLTLLELGANPAAADSRGRTPLHALSEPPGGRGGGGGGGDAAASSSSSGGGGGGGESPLCCADGVETIVSALVAAGADPSTPDRGNLTPMAAAAAAGDAAAAYALWAAGGVQVRLPQTVGGDLAGDLMDAIDYEISERARLGPGVEAGARALGELRGLTPGLRELLLGGCATLRRAEREAAAAPAAARG
ncbi:hypothetical protein Rsub_00907 [Raphidocelis subcapitata]|uniref:Uncharacterized protein n=1 Tax=Raphidocelis subcapitata TaxID=307507 RepID=A0A2V0NTN6_9CHLO|nr:hypothetical protein Rsub_00907 [Raphidocelis subcapitata]|eukprot:GBF88195.1 hypothetical protein Rsub_00907 [Raphidocelis subcapitata]